MLTAVLTKITCMHQIQSMYIDQNLHQHYA